MTLDEIKYFNDQFRSVRDELKQDLKDLRTHIDKTLGGHALKLEDHEKRINTVENFNWRMTALCAGIVFITQLAINLAVGIFGK